MKAEFTSCSINYGVDNYDDNHVNADTCIDGSADGGANTMVVLMMMVVPI